MVPSRRAVDLMLQMKRGEGKSLCLKWRHIMRWLINTTCHISSSFIVALKVKKKTEASRWKKRFECKNRKSETEKNLLWIIYSKIWMKFNFYSLIFSLNMFCLWNWCNFCPDLSPWFHRIIIRTYCISKQLHSLHTSNMMQIYLFQTTYFFAYVDFIRPIEINKTKVLKY